MAKLGTLLGTILAEVSAARVQADLESVKIANMYASDPFLKQMPIPRFRLPEITIDIPIAIENEKLDYNIEDSINLTSNDKKSILREAEKKANVIIGSEEKKLLLKALDSLEKKNNFIPISYHPIKSVENNLEKEILKHIGLNKKLPKNFSTILVEEIQEKSIKKTLKNEVGIVAKTSVLKELSDGTNLMNIHLTIREDSFEVKSELDDDGQLYTIFSPE